MTRLRATPVHRDRGTGPSMRGLIAAATLGFVCVTANPSIAAAAGAVQDRDYPRGSGRPETETTNGALSANGAFRVFAVDASSADETPVIFAGPLPKRAVEIFELPWDRHKSIFGVSPDIQIEYLGKPAVFIRRRPLSQYGDGGVAAHVNFFPVAEGEAGAAICTIPGARKWCRIDSLTVRYNFDELGNPFGPAFVSHEFIHTYQSRFFGRSKEGLPHWVYEGQANGFGYGIMEIYPEFTRAALAKRYAGSNDTLFGFTLGLRHYDQPLSIDFAQNNVWRHPDYPPRTGSIVATGVDKSSQDTFDASIKGGNANRHIVMTGYMTGSFFRHALMGRPGGHKAVRAMFAAEQLRPTDRRDERSVLRWIDDGLKLATVDGLDGAARPVWRRGIRDVFPEMIVELADLPDLIVGSRAGKLARDPFDRRLWANPCFEIDLSDKPSEQYRLTISPIAARCFRVRLDPDAYVTDWVRKDEDSPYAPGVPATPIGLIVTVSSEDRRACADIDLGTRGQMMTHGIAQTLEDGRCTVSWSPYYAPLHPKRAGGTAGAQTFVLTNVNDDAEDTVERTVFLSVVQPRVSANVTGTATPAAATPGGEQKAPKPLPRPRRASQPAAAPPVVLIPPAEPEPDCGDEDRALFACSDQNSGFKLIVGDYGELVRAQSAVTATGSMLYLAANVTRGSGPGGVEGVADTLHAILERRAEGVSAALMQQVMRGAGQDAGLPMSGMVVSVHMDRLAPGQTGVFPARVEVAWSDETDGGEVDSVNAAATRPDGNGCVVVERRQTNAQITITQNTEGFVIGSLNAQLFEPEPDAEKACRAPFRTVGVLDMSFAHPALIYADPSAIDVSRSILQSDIDLDLGAQFMLPLDDRSDVTADDLAQLAQAGGPLGGSRMSGIPESFQCSVILLDKDYKAFAAAVWATQDVESATGEERTIALSQIERMARSVLKPDVCAWALADRPWRWELRGGE